jgi:hypothetical protein
MGHFTLFCDSRVALFRGDVLIRVRERGVYAA